MSGNIATRQAYLPWHALTRPLSQEQWLQPFSEAELFRIDVSFKLTLGVALLLLAGVVKGLTPWLLLPVAILFYILFKQENGPLFFEKCSDREMGKVYGLASPQLRENLQSLHHIQGFLLKGQLHSALSVDAVT